METDILVSLEAARPQPESPSEEERYAEILRADLQQQVDEFVQRWIDGMRDSPFLWVPDQTEIKVEVPLFQIRRRSERPRIAEVIALQPEERSARFGDRALVQVILGDRGESTIDEIDQALREFGIAKSRDALQQLLSRMNGAGEIERVRRGRYDLPEEDNPSRRATSSGVDQL